MPKLEDARYVWVVVNSSREGLARALNTMEAEEGALQGIYPPHREEDLFTLVYRRLARAGEEPEVEPEVNRVVRQKQRPGFL